MKLNLGNGRTYLDGWCNIDLEHHPSAKKPPDIVCDVRKVPLPDNCAVLAQAIHVFEHFALWECAGIIDEWRRLLRPGGELIMEMPDIIKCCHNVLNDIAKADKPHQLGMWGIYGEITEDKPLMGHKWGWTFATIQPFLSEHGFTDIREERTQYHNCGRDVRDFRVTARKV